MKKSGFSLVELSIVLVILGLLVGGILGGQSLIHAAELRSVMKEYESTIMALNSFKGKYNALAGDMTNATSYWTAADADNATCLAMTSRTVASTCNGNGDGNLQGHWGAEHNMVWEQLSLAGLTSGNYSSIGMNNVVLGTSTPAGKLTGSGWVMLNYATTWQGAAIFWGGKQAKNTLSFVGLGTASANWESGTTGILPPEDALYIDQKMDDGKPGLGFVRTSTSAAAGQCTNSATAADYATATYTLTSTANACKLFFDVP